MKKHIVDMTKGSVHKNLIAYAVPVILANLLQVFFSAADMIIVGRFDGSTALAAVGSTVTIISFIVQLFGGFTGGAGIVIARYFGAKDFDGISRAIHTQVSMTGLVGIFVMIIGISTARPMLNAMSYPPDVMEQAATYLYIYYMGLPGLNIYNACRGALGAVGDTRRPLMFLTLAGVLNILFNLLFVIGFRWGVAGVALATTLSQYLSAIPVIIILLRTNEAYKLSPKKLKIHKREVIEMMRIGIPSGIQASLMSLSNVSVQSTVNSFGASAMSGHAAGANVENFAHIVMGGITSGFSTMVAQCYGARQFDRIKKGIKISFTSVSAVVLLMMIVINIFSSQLLGIYTNDLEAIRVGAIKLRIAGTFCFINSMANCMSSIIKVFGQPVTATLISLGGLFGTRMIYIYFILPRCYTIENMYLLFPISYVVTLIFMMIFAARVWKKEYNRLHN